MTNVVIITETFRPDIGGLETHVEDLCEYLRRNGHRVFVLTYQPLNTRTRAPAIERSENLEIRRFRWFGHNWHHKLEPYPPLLFLYLFPGLLVGSFFFFLRYGRQVDVIHAQGLITGLVAKVINTFFRKRTVITLHALFNPIYGFKSRPVLSEIVKWILSSFDVIISLAVKSKKELLAIGLLDDKIKVCTHWVDMERFRILNQEECKRRLNLTGKFVVLFVGRLIEVKGINLLLEVANRVDHKINFVFIGDGPLADTLRKSSNKVPNVIFLGPVRNTDIALYYNAADVFIIPSQYEELFGRVVIESLACGLPVIASNRGSLPEIVNRSVGVVVEPSVDDITQALNYLYNNPEELSRMRRNCRNYAVERFSENNARLFADTYENSYR